MLDGRASSFEKAHRDWHASSHSFRSLKTSGATQTRCKSSRRQTLVFISSLAKLEISSSRSIPLFTAVSTSLSHPESGAEHSHLDESQVEGRKKKSLVLSKWLSQSDAPCGENAALSGLPSMCCGGPSSTVEILSLV